LLAPFNHIAKELPKKNTKTLMFSATLGGEKIAGVLQAPLLNSENHKNKSV